MARPSKFTAETVKAILNGVRAGLPYHLAAEAAGVSASTFHAWQAGQFPRGSGPALKVEFSESLKKAKAQGAYRLLALINRAADQQWTAAAWILERRYSGDFGRDAELNRRLEELEQRLDATPPANVRRIG